MKALPDVTALPRAMQDYIADRVREVMAEDETHPDAFTATWRVIQDIDGNDDAWSKAERDALTLAVLVPAGVMRPLTEAEYEARTVLGQRNAKARAFPKVKGVRYDFVGWPEEVA